LHATRRPRPANASHKAGMPATNRIVAVVDPISTGACFAKFLSDRGYELVRVFSDTIPDGVKALVAEGLEVNWLVTVQHEGKVASTARALKGLGCSDILVGSEPGVSLHAALAAVPEDKLELRRNKYLQSEAIRAHGLDAVKQTLAHTADDVERFIAGFDPIGHFKAVVKPVEGAGSDGVSICNSADAVRAAYGRLEGTKNILGLDNYAVLCQEYLEGDEWVVDTVSRGGKHKVVALWKYDKRDYHGSPVVYHGMRLYNVEADPELLSRMVAYVTGVLDSLGITDGAIHSEIMDTPRGPVLVEANCRLHGGEGIWLLIADACLHYSQVSALHDAVFAPEGFYALPDTPTHPLCKQGAWVTIRAPAEGTITHIDTEKFKRIRGLQSFIGEYVAPCIAVGGRVRKTVDATTVHGCFNLAHAASDTLEADCALAQQLINEGLFTIQPPAASEPDVVSVTTDEGIRLSFSFSEKEEVANSSWGLAHVWKPLVTAPASPRKLREVRRGWRF